MRKLFQMETPRGLQKYVDDLWGSARAVYLVCLATWQRIVAQAIFRTQRTDWQKSFATANRFTAVA